MIVSSTTFMGREISLSLSQDPFINNLTIKVPATDQLYVTESLRSRQ
jgi:hypothetical protein